MENDLSGKLTIYTHRFVSVCIFVHGETNASRMPTLKNLSLTMPVQHFSARAYAMKFQFPFHRFRVSFIFSRAGYGIKFRFVHSCNGEYATAWKAAREIRSGESFGRVTVKLNIRKFGVPVGCLFSATVERRTSYIYIYTDIYVGTIKCGFSSRRKSRNWSPTYIYQISGSAG